MRKNSRDDTAAMLTEEEKNRRPYWTTFVCDNNCCDVTSSKSYFNAKSFFSFSDVEDCDLLFR